jgi:hypothetical protein
MNAPVSKLSPSPQQSSIQASPALPKSPSLFSGPVVDDRRFRLADVSYGRRLTGCHTNYSYCSSFIAGKIAGASRSG